VGMSLDTDKVVALLEWHDTGEIRLSSWERDLLFNVLECEELGRELWTGAQARRVDEIYLRKIPSDYQEIPADLSPHTDGEWSALEEFEKDIESLDASLNEAD